MSKYSRLLREVNFPNNSEEYLNLVLNNLIIKDDEAIKKGISKKTGNSKFRLGEVIFATIEFIAKLPDGENDLPGFVLGLWEYVRKLNEYATRSLLPHEAMIVGYAALIYRDGGYHAWPHQNELRQRLPVELTDDEFHQACDSLKELGCIDFLDDGRIKVIEDIDVLDE